MDSEPSSTPAIRLSDAERDAVVQQLNSAMTEGRISLTEFEQRSRQAYAATYPADLVPLTSDLPQLRSAALPAIPANPSPARRRWAVAIWGGNERVGAWDPGDSLNTVTIMGGNVIDLTEVKAEHVTINAFTMMGGTEIIVPHGAKLDLSGFILMGGTSNETQAAGPSTMTVRVRSFGLMGGCEVRHLSAKEQAKRAAR